MVEKMGFDRDYKLKSEIAREIIGLQLNGRFSVNIVLEKFWSDVAVM